MTRKNPRDDLWVHHLARERCRIRYMTNVAIANLKIVRTSACERCGVPDIRKDHENGQKIVAHHITYKTHDRIAWLCQPCHAQVHGAGTCDPDDRYWTGLGSRDYMAIKQDATQMCFEMVNQYSRTLTFCIQSKLLRERSPRHLFRDVAWTIPTADDARIAKEVEFVLNQQKQLAFKRPARTKHINTRSTS